MGRFVECQAAVVPWGGRPNFRRAKVGLIRKGSIVYLAIFFTPNNYCKFQIEQNLVEIFPAAIRFVDLKKDLFTRKASDENSWSNMVREMKVLLKRDKLIQSGKADVLDKFISSIPLFSACSVRDLTPSRTKAKLINNHPVLGQRNATGDDNVDLFVDNIQPSQNITHHADDENAKIKEHCQMKGPKQLTNKNLRAIEIKGLEVIPKELWCRNKLWQLTLNDCNLSVVPKQLEEFSSTLVLLNLENNNIAELPTRFCCKMNNLHTLNLAYNEIETLPIEIKFFHKLVDLNVSNNRLRMLPSTFSDLRSLRTLKLDNNNLSQLPAFRMEDIKLQYLDVSHNPFDGALNKSNLFEVVPSYDEPLGYNESLFCPLSPKNNKFPKLFEIAMLRIVRSDRLLKLASEAELPRTIVSTMQRDIFKCYKCSKMSILPAYNSTDILDYVQHVRTLVTTGNYHSGMTFMKLLCKNCFDSMSL